MHEKLANIYAQHASALRSYVYTYLREVFPNGSETVSPASIKKLHVNKSTLWNYSHCFIEKSKKENDILKVQFTYPPVLRLLPGANI